MTLSQKLPKEGVFKQTIKIVNQKDWMLVGVSSEPFDRLKGDNGHYLGGWNNKDWGIRLNGGRKVKNDNWSDCLGSLNEGDSVTLVVDRSSSSLFACKNSGPLVLVFSSLPADLYFACSMSFTDSCIEFVDK